MAELRSLLYELAPDTHTTATVTQLAKASGSARVHQAGRDLNVDER
ncbi:hypothetical protein ACH46N_01445 [Streptomyces pristinaespiralis]|uniref:Uncharacterized protein n=1 Tax=Streptomyces pristinaespiralis TaxID=38300 RepID=A0A0M4D2B1_STRPR|nr:hypothetical protein [Streptomyces pristinaespiralis]ALC19766.1 hypothetical protein SPRI_1460 [Streptomyces pristinaespiralis]